MKVWGSVGSVGKMGGSVLGCGGGEEDDGRGLGDVVKCGGGMEKCGEGVGKNELEYGGGE